MRVKAVVPVDLSIWNMKGHGCVTLPSPQVGAVLGLGRVNLCCVVKRPQRHPLLGESEVDPVKILPGIALRDQ